MSLGVEEVEMLRSSTWEVAAKYGTLNSMISSLSKVMKERRICREVASLNM